MNTPSDRSALFVKEDGLIYVNEVPQEPHYIENNRLYNTVMHHQLQAAKDSAVLCQDQEKARELLFLKHCIFPKEIALKQATGIYPIPDLKWKKVERVCEDSGTDDMGRKVDFEWVAVLSPSSIEEKSENQEDIWNDVFQNYMIWQDQEPKLSDLLKDFQISRR